MGAAVGLIGFIGLFHSLTLSLCCFSMPLTLSRSLSQGGSLQEQQAGRALSHRGTTQECIVCVRKTGQPRENSTLKFFQHGAWMLKRVIFITPSNSDQKELLQVVVRDVPGKHRNILCCKTRVTYTHTQVSRGRILKVASECFGAESTHSKLRLRLYAKPGVEFDFNLEQKHVLKVEK